MQLLRVLRCRLHHCGYGCGAGREYRLDNTGQETEEIYAPLTGANYERVELIRSLEKARQWLVASSLPICISFAIP
jgi:hypothetical protein